MGKSKALQPLLEESEEASFVPTYGKKAGTAPADDLVATIRRWQAARDLRLAAEKAAREAVKEEAKIEEKCKALLTAAVEHAGGELVTAVGKLSIRETPVTAHVRKTLILEV